MRFWLLGTLLVTRDDGSEVEIRGRLRRTLLAELLLNANTAVSADRLVELLWGDSTHGLSGDALYNQLGRLRQALGRGEEGGAGRIRAVPPGYVLDVSPGELDVHRFAEHASAGRKAAAGADWTGASAEFGAALGLWRANPLADLPDLADESAARHLEEERWATLQGLAEAELNLGRHAEVVALLRDVAPQQPLRESLHAQLMLAMYRDGRRAEALEIFRALSRALSEAAGLEPGAAVRELHERMTREDPDLQWAPPRTAPTRQGSGPGPMDARQRRNQLPIDTRLFTGRQAEVARLTALARDTAERGGAGTVTISALDGLGGVGKSALAVHVAHQVGDLFPGGQLFVDLRGATVGLEPLTPMAAIGQLLRSLDVPDKRIPGTLPDCTELLRDRLRGSRTLILLDNASAGAQVRPLLPDVPGCLVLITSRTRLADVEGAHLLRLDVLSPGEAAALLSTAAGADRVREDDPAVLELAELCGRIPLALRIVAARIRHDSALTVAQLAAQLRDERSRLGELHDEERDLADVLGTSYADLPAAQQRTFRLLSLVPGTDVDADAAAALLDLARADAESLLDRLVERNLLVEPSPGRYRMHDLVRLFGAEQAGAAGHEAERADAVERLLFWYAESAKAAWRAVEAARATPASTLGIGSVVPQEFAAAEEAFAWHDRESGNLIAAVDAARTEGRYEYGLELARALNGLMHMRSNAARLLEVAEAGLACAVGLGDFLARSQMARSKGVALALLGRFDEAVAVKQQALEMARAAGSEKAEGEALVGLCSTFAAAKRLDEALDVGRQAVALFDRMGIAHHAAGPLINMAAALSLADRNEEALVLTEQAVELGRKADELYHLAPSLAQLAAVMHATGSYDPERLDATYREAVEMLRAIENPRYELAALLGYGVFLEEHGRFAESVEVLTTAEHIGAGLGVPLHDKARGTLRRSQAALDAAAASAAPDTDAAPDADAPDSPASSAP